MTEIESTESAPRELGRRNVIKGAAWSVPVIAAAVATPLAAAGTPASQGLIDLNAGCIQAAGVALFPGFSLNNVGTAAYSGTITVTETIDLSAITTPGLDVVGSTVRGALWGLLLVQGVASGSSAGVSAGNWQCASNCGSLQVAKIYRRTVTFNGTIAAGSSAYWGNLVDVTRILNALEDFDIALVKRSATITSPTGNPPIVDAGPSDLSFNLLGGC